MSRTFLHPHYFLVNVVKRGSQACALCGGATTDTCHIVIGAAKFRQARVK